MPYGTTTVNSGATNITTNTTIWTQWNNDYVLAGPTISATSASSTSDNIWAIWVRSDSAGGTAANTAEAGETLIVQATGTGVITASATTNIVWGTWNANYVREQRLEEDYNRRTEAATAEYRQRQIEAEAERAAARERAAILLQENLSEQQRLELADKGHFSLRVIDSKTQEQRLYRIRRGRHGNVDRIDESGRVLNRFCIHPTIVCPDEDTMLAQKLLLEHDEQRFLQIANRS